jgi:hypothetical protein
MKCALSSVLPCQKDLARKQPVKCPLLTRQGYKLGRQCVQPHAISLEGAQPAGQMQGHTERIEMT